MSYTDELSLRSLSENIVDLIQNNTTDRENIFTNQYCLAACENYVSSIYTTDTFPFRYHINKGDEIWIDGISEAGLNDNDFNKTNITINSKYTIDGKEYTITGLGDFAFGIGDVTNKTEEETDALFGCISITLPLTITHIGDRAFVDNTNTKTSKYRTKRLLEYVQGTDNVSEITGRAAFGNCPNLKTMYLPRLNSIGKSIFQSCANLTDVCFGDVTEIPESAFRQCFRLTSITKFDNSIFEIKTIGNRAFEKALALKNFKFDVTKVTSVGENAFWFSSYETDWQAMIDNDCTFGLRATKYQLWNNQEALTHKFNFTPCLNTNGKNYSFQQSYNGWRSVTLGNSTDLYFGADGCTWMTSTMAHNILSGQNLTPVQFNTLVANSKDSAKANAQIMSNGSTTSSVTVGSLVILPMETFQSIESIQGIYDGLAQGYVYDTSLVTSFESGTWNVTGSHAMLLVGVDENGYIICSESNYAGSNHTIPVSGLIHFDLFTWFTDRTHGNNYLYNWVNKITYNPNYERK